MVTVLDEEEKEGSPADRRGTVLVPQHTLEPGYSHLYSIPPQPPQHQHHGRGGVAARVTLAFRDNGDNDGAVSELLLRSGDRLCVAS